MAVRRIVANVATPDPAATARFYETVFDLAPLMDHGWIVTSGAAAGTARPAQVSFASEGGSGTPVPALSIEVDDLDATLSRLAGVGCAPEYGPVVEPWGVRRIFIRDPAGTLVNVLEHVAAATPDARA